MTLTAVLPTVRASIPDPFDPGVWPAHTAVGVDDVFVAGVSMVRLAAVAETPCVHSAEQAPPRWRPRTWVPADVSVVVTTVVSVRRPRPGVVLLGVDAVLPTGAVLEEARLVGRVSTAPSAPVHLLPAAGATGASVGSADEPFRRFPAPLPSDVREGDLLCVPCPVVVRHRDLVHSDS